MKRTLFCLLLLCAVIDGAMTLPGSAAVLPTNAIVGGKTIGEWSAEWFKSLYALSTNGPNCSPMSDPDGRCAHNGQPAASVWFLGSGTGLETGSITRTFTVPQGKYLLVPLLVATIDNIDVVPPLSPDEMRDGIRAFMDNPRELHATIDGVAVTNLIHHRAETPVFNIQYTDPNNYLTLVYGHSITGLVDPVVGNGYWLLIEPLPVGSHVLRYGGAYPLPYYFPTDITANITVVPDPNQYVMPTNAVVAGKAINDWTVDWWKWSYSLSTNEHPWFDTDGAWAHKGQRAPVFFVSGAAIESIGTNIQRSYTVPQNTRLLVPLLIGEAENIGVDPPFPVPELYDFLAAFLDSPPSLRFSIDGVSVPDLLAHRHKAPVYTLELNPDNLKSLYYGYAITNVDPVVADGYWLMLEPLPPGEHVFHWFAGYEQPGIVLFDRTDRITVVPDGNQYVMPTNAIVGGKTIEEWSAEWWKWIFSWPTNQNPLLDMDGSSANNGQPQGDVFFLAGVEWRSTTARRAFTVPEGKYLFFPPLNVWSDNVFVDPPWTFQQLQDANDAYVRSATNLYATVDGIALTNLYAHRAIAPAFNFYFENPDNLESYVANQPFTGLNDPIAADGFWIMLKPLPPGEHVIKFGGLFGPPLNIPLDITATITVVPDANQYVMPNNAVVGGKTIPEWTAEWWKWAWTTSTNRNPFFDTNGRWASVNQPDAPVFFLAGLSTISGTVNRSFAVPEGKYLLFPTINSYCDNVDVGPPPFTVEELRQCAAATVNSVSELHASLGGMPITNLFGYRQISPVFSFYHYSPDNLESWAAGHPVEGLIDPAVADGYWVMLKPLPPGTYVLNFGGTTGQPDHFTIDITDSITVVPNPNQYVMPDDAVVEGKTIGEWTAEWNKWAYSAPTNRHPFLDSDGSWAHYGQAGPVFFAPGGPANVSGPPLTLTYNVPENKYLLVPIVNATWDNIDVFPPCTVDQLRDKNAAIISGVTELHAVVDGLSVPFIKDPVSGFFNHRAISPVFSFDFTTADNINTLLYGHPVTGLIDPIVADGYWLMIKPLPLGAHELQTGATLGFPSFSRSLIHKITVVPDPNQYVLPPDAEVGSKTVGDWTAECWKWVWSISTNENPQLDCDGQWANNRQPYSEVFFIAPLNGATPPPCTRTFTVPENRHLLVPLLPVTIDNINVDPPLTIPQMYDQIADAVRDPRELHATIDGVSITNLLSHRATSTPFSFDFGPICDNALTVAYEQCITNLVDPIIADGYWLILEPLPRGEHTIRVGGTDRLGYFLPHDLILNITVIEDPTQYVLAPDATLCGKTQAEMSAEWWKYNFSLSTNVAIPSEIPGRVYLPAGPRGDCPLYYLAGRGFAGLTRDPIFTIPESNHIFFPIQSVLCDNVDVIPPMSNEQLRDCAASLVGNITQARLTIDGTVIPDLGNRRQIAPLFNFDFTDPDNIYSQAYGRPFTGLVDPIAADGYYVLLKPLSQGKHTLSLAVSFGPPHNTSWDLPFYINVISDPNQLVLPANAVIAGKTIGEWTAEWWKWIYPISTNQNPHLETNGAFAHVGQPAGDVFFLAGLPGFSAETVTRTFTVPDNKYLLLPVLIVAVDNINTDPPLPIDVLREQAAAIISNPKKLHASIDGIAITNLFAHRAISPIFNIFFTNADNFATYNYGTAITNLVDPMLSDGYWLMLRPLPPGQHVIRYGGTYSNDLWVPNDIIARINVVSGSTNVPPPPPPMVSTNPLPVNCPVPPAANPSSVPREDFWVPDGPVNAIVETNGVLYIGGTFDYVSPSSLTGGAFDQLSGAPVPNFPKVNGAIKVIEPDRAGGWFIGGIFNSVGGYPLSNLAHVRADGSVDAKWAPNPDGAVLTMVATADKLYVGGMFQSIGDHSRSLVAALEPATGFVLPFRADAHTSFPKPSVNALLLSGNTLYLAGYFSFINGAEREHLGAVDAETGMVTPWHPNGYTGSQAGSRIDALAILDNILFVGGTFTSIGGTQTNGPSRNFIAALNVTGPDFGSVIEWDPNADGPVTSLAVTCDTVYVGGAFTHIGGQPRNRIAALDITTARATEWNPNANGDVLALRLAGNTIYAGGKFTEIGGDRREFLAALDTKTGRATLFSPKADFGITGLAVSGATVYAGGGVAGGGKLRKNLAALDVRTGRPLDWAPIVGGETIINAFPFRGVYALAATADTLYLGGPFTQIDGQPRNHVGAVAISTGRPTPWQPDVNGIVEALAISDDSVFLGGRFTHVNGLPRQNIAAVDAVSGVPSTWNPGANDKVKTLVACDNALFAGGIFTTIAGAPHNRLAALEIDSGLSFNWNPALNDQVVGMALAGPTIYVGGQFSTVNAEPRNRVAALDLISGTATCWNPGARTVIGEGERSAAINAIALAGNTIFVGGSFNALGGQPRNNLAALSANCPSAPASWNPNADGPVVALTIRGDTLFAAGGFQNLNGQFRPYLAVFPPEGAPRIALQPRSEQVGIGANVTLGGEASGEGLSFQWQFNGANIPGATSPVLTIPNAQVANSGEYTLVVTNSVGLASSRPATLTVLQPVTIVSQPRRQTVSPGRTVTLSVGARGNPPPTYQWRLNGVNIPGAIFPSLVISNAQPTDGGSYSVVAANVGGAISSDIATVRVKSPSLPFQNNLSSAREDDDSDDDDDNGDGDDDDDERSSSGRGWSLSGSRRSTFHRARIISASGVGRGNNRRADKEENEPNHAGKPGGNSVWIRWLAPASGIATFSTRGSSFDTLLAVYTGNDFTDLVSVTADEDRAGFATSETSFNATAGTEYLIAVDGLAGASGDIVLSWSMDTSTVPLPRIIVEPRHQTVTPKATVAFEVDAVSTTPLRFQWFFGCRLLVGETNRYLFIPYVSARDVGGYRCLVMNASTHVTESVEALLEIGPDAQIVSQDKLEDVIANLTTPPPPPPTDVIAAGLSTAGLAASGIITVSPGSIDSQIFNNTRSTSSAGERNHCGVLGGASKWFGVQATEQGVLLVDTIGSGIDTVLAVYTGADPLSLIEITCDNNSAPDGIRSLVRFNAGPPTNYWLVVDGVNADVGVVNLNWKHGVMRPLVPKPFLRTARLGQSFTLCVTASDSFPPPTYVWLFNGRIMLGETNAILTIMPVQFTHAGTYAVVARNFAGAVTNSFGFIDVAAPTTIIPTLVTNSGIRYLRISGTPAKKYVVERASGLSAPWLPLYTNTSSTAAPILFTDPQPATSAQRFYRVVPWP